MHIYCRKEQRVQQEALRSLFSLFGFRLILSNVARDEINMDFAKDEINDVTVFRFSICSVGRHQLFLFSLSSHPLPLPFPDPTAGSVSAPAIGLCPVQCLSQSKLWWEGCHQHKMNSSPSPSVVISSGSWIL